MPFITVATTDTSEVRTGSLGAPLERVVVDRLAGDRIVAIALGLGTERTDHLRVAVVATFAYVDIAALEMQCTVLLDAREPVSVVSVWKNSGTISTSPPTLITSDDQYRQQADVLFNDFM
jgi:hypothetical protein